MGWGFIAQVISVEPDHLGIKRYSLIPGLATAQEVCPQDLRRCCCTCLIFVKNQ
jgi:hypothetical protein